MNVDDAAQPDEEVGEGEASTPDLGPKTLLRARGLTKSYPTAKGPLTVLDGVDLAVRRGEFVALHRRRESPERREEDGTAEVVLDAKEGHGVRAYDRCYGIDKAGYWERCDVCV